MTVLLAGDIGGTKTNLRLVYLESIEPSTKIPSLITLYEQKYISREFTDLVPMVNKFLQAASEDLGEEHHVEKACFGIAGPVINNTCNLTNLSWDLEAERLARELSIAQITLINDFAANGYGILGLPEEDLSTLQKAQPNPEAPIAILGAGTGLGAAFVIPLPGGGYKVFASEGSHADFAPRNPLEFELLNFIRERNNLDRVSVERVVSGLGITTIYEFLRERNPSEESPRLASIYQTWRHELGKSEKTIDLTAEISQAALKGEDYLSGQTMKLFVEAYGAEAGNFALKLLAFGGLYIAGGIAPKILPLLELGDFMRAFLSKGRMRRLLETIPVQIVLNPKLGLIGAAIRAAQ